MKILVTGGCGFLGSNLAAESIKRGHELAIVDNFYRTGSRDNYSWLKGLGEFTFYEKDTRKQSDIEQIFEQFRPEAVFHLAGQVAMTTSIEDPRFDFETNVLGGTSILGHTVVTKHGVFSSCHIQALLSHSLLCISYPNTNAD